MESLTSIVSSALEARGVLAKIRAELRANVFAAIHEEELPESSPTSAFMTSMLADPAGQLVMQLVHELLTTCGLHYTASVFLSEAGLREDSTPPRNSLAAALRLPSVPVEKEVEPLLQLLTRAHLSDQPPSTVRRPAGTSPGALVPTGELTVTPGMTASSTTDCQYENAVPTGHGRGGTGASTLNIPTSCDPVSSPAAAMEEERRLDALESKLAGLAGIPATIKGSENNMYCGTAAPCESGRSARDEASALCASRGTISEAHKADTTEDLFADEIDDEELDEFEDDFEDDEVRLCCDDCRAKIRRHGWHALLATHLSANENVLWAPWPVSRCSLAIEPN